MPLTIVVGGQFGGEGKGKVTYNFAKDNDINIGVRIGGANSGHTVVIDDNPVILRQLPVTAFISGSTAVLAAGSYIDLGILKEEIRLTGISKDGLIIDPNAVIILNQDKENERDLRKDIGSTASGTGQALIRRISRAKDIKLAKDTPDLKDYIKDTKDFLRISMNNGQKAIIEGTQGFGLSILHAPYYPYCTSRDTTASGFLSETGLSPFDVENIIMAIRTCPIRVEGNSGELANEISWSELHQPPKITSVTKKIRRVAKFDPQIVKKAIVANKPNIIVLNHLDYINKDERDEFVNFVESSIGQNIDFIGLDNKWIMKK